VFADAKLHDIPNTVGRAASVISSAGARWVSVHASGGSTMIEAAARGMGGSGGVLAVTVLTSFEADDLASIGVGSPLDDQIVLLAHLARNAGAEGLVCSPAEARRLRTGGFDLTLFTPGVRPRGASADDQRRVATPEDAIAAGADYLVIGRPITRADDPVGAVREIVASINHSD
jgi:orotidine-5'-phosphate decarboxylase